MKILFLAILVFSSSAFSIDFDYSKVDCWTMGTSGGPAITTKIIDNRMELYRDQSEVPLFTLPITWKKDGMDAIYSGSDFYLKINDRTIPYTHYWRAGRLSIRYTFKNKTTIFNELPVHCK